MSECEDCIDKLERKVTALTAELEQAKAYAAKADEALLDCAAAHATERAARELAEAGLLSEQEGKAVLIQDLQQAERERDTALARVAEVTEQRDLWAKQCNMASEAQADAASKLSTALAALKAGTSREVVAHAETLGKLRALELDREEFTQRDAAERMRLVKLVQELEAKNESLREECDLFSQDKVATEAPNWDACHRQHEQCMKLLGRIQALLLDPNAQRTEWKIRNVQDLLREMLSKGELPEGWDE